MFADGISVWYWCRSEAVGVETGTQLVSTFCLPVLHGRLARLFNALIWPEGALPLGVVERLALDKGRKLLALIPGKWLSAS